MMRAREKLRRSRGARGRCGFTLAEVAVTVALFALLVAMVITAFNRTIDSVVEGRLRSAAAAVAQRQIETLLARMEEPNTHQLHGQDEIDPRFQWTLKLTREPVAGMEGQSNLATSVIRAQVTVDAKEQRPGSGPLLEMERYVATLDPLEGRAVAVPFEDQESTEKPEEAQWQEELRDELGREPTLDELLEEMVRRGEISPDMFDQIQGEGLEMPELPDLPEAP